MITFYGCPFAFSDGNGCISLFCGPHTYLYMAINISIGSASSKAELSVLQGSSSCII